MNKQPIDPRTTHRLVPTAKFDRNSALYSTYTVIERGATNVKIERKAEFCQRAS